ncbi:MAG: hypothetical protein M3198_18930 [Actinomycetota bacterium]|nr:hypothetical protein [Actinomycetota bacterium]
MRRMFVATRGFTRIRTAVAVIVFVVSAMGLVATTPARATFSGDNGRIFFRQGKNIYGVSATEDSTRQVVAKGADFPGKPKLLDVSVSPTGKKIAFSAAGDIWVKTIGSAGAKNVTKRASNNLDLTQARYPAWSPEGDQLVFQATRNTSGFPRNRLYRIDLDGTGIKQLHLFDTNLSYHGFPDWSSQDVIVFVVLDDLWVMNPNGLEKERLTTDGMNYTEPSWSPAGDEIVVTSEIGTTIHAPNPGVVIVDAVSGEVTAQVTGPADYDSHYESPSWSPDEQSIAFAGWQDDSTSPVRKVLQAPAAAGSAASVQEVYEGATHSFEPAWGVAVP